MTAPDNARGWEDFAFGNKVLINFKHNDPASPNPDKTVSIVQFSKSKIILSAGSRPGTVQC